MAHQFNKPALVLGHSGERVRLSATAGPAGRDHDEILRVLRLATRDSAEMARMRRWCYDIGIDGGHSDRALLSRLTEATRDGRMLLGIERVATAANGGSAGDTRTDLPPPGGHQDKPTLRRPKPGSAPPPLLPATPPADQKSWIEVELMFSDGVPLDGEAYELCDTQGTTVRSGHLDAKGRARETDLSDGAYSVRFPQLDVSYFELLEGAQ